MKLLKPLLCAGILFVSPALLWAEVPPLPEAQLRSTADLIVTGTVSSIMLESKEYDILGIDGADRPAVQDITVRTNYLIEVKVNKVEKGAPTSTVVGALGYSVQLPPGATGGTGHYYIDQGGIQHYITDLKRGSKVRVFLSPPVRADGARELLSPNGFLISPVPPLPEALLRSYADLIVTGTVSSITLVSKENLTIVGSTMPAVRTNYRVEVKVNKVEKAVEKGDLRSTVVDALGYSVQLPPGVTGGTGHYYIDQGGNSHDITGHYYIDQGGNSHDITDLKKGSKVRVFLSPQVQPDGARELLFPNGFLILP
jgi:hypothetical protein